MIRSGSWILKPKFSYGNCNFTEKITRTCIFCIHNSLKLCVKHLISILPHIFSRFLNYAIDYMLLIPSWLEPETAPMPRRQWVPNKNCILKETRKQHFVPINSSHRVTSVKRKHYVLLNFWSYMPLSQQQFVITHLNLKWM